MDKPFHPVSPYYLGPGAKSFVACKLDNLPGIPAGCTRVICISDTHNEQEGINLPWGHILVHSGDVLTESGLRHISGRSSGHPKATQHGVELLDRFAQWLANQPHPHKAFIGGNHDWVLQALGAAGVTDICNKYAKPGTVIYLEHQEATVGPVKIFGSPFAHWGGHNDAFMHKNPTYNEMTKGTHIVLTHMPPILPKSSHPNGQREQEGIIEKMRSCGTLLSVSGHCHWAHGLYFPKNGGPSCVVASICDSHWQHPDDLKPGPSGKRVDSVDKINGGYNLKFAVIICDLLIPGGPPSANATWNGVGGPIPTPLSASKERTKKPALLFFGPPTDPDMVTRFLPLFDQWFETYHFDDAQEAKKAIEDGEITFNFCVAKLGSSKNNGKTIIKYLKQKTPTSFLIIHSATAKNNTGTQAHLMKAGGVDMFVDHDSEDVMMAKLKELAGRK